MTWIAKPKTIQKAICRTQNEMWNIDQTWGGRGPSRLARLGLELTDQEERMNAQRRLKDLHGALAKSKMIYRD